MVSKETEEWVRVIYCGSVSLTVFFVWRFESFAKCKSGFFAWKN